VKKDFATANSLLEGMLDPKTGILHNAEIVADAQMCLGAVKLALHNGDEASGLFEKVIHAYPDYDPDPLTYPSDVLLSFANARIRVMKHDAEERATAEAQRRADLQRERAALQAHVHDLEAVATQETVVIEHSRLVALMPFGIGQFQNGRSALGWTFLLTEVGAIGATFAMFGVYRYNIDQYNAALANTVLSPHARNDLANEYSVRAQNVRTTELIFVAGIGALVIGGIVQAQLDFVPERRFTRSRTAAPQKKAAAWPLFAPLPSGGMAGVEGRF
jgi:hypothetical protein